MSAEFPMFPVLMVDDEDHLLMSFDSVLRSNGISNIISCNDSRKVMEILSSSKISLMLLDLFMPHVSGEEILSEVSRDYSEIPIIVITGVDNVETAVDCIKTGAFDYIVKPVEEGRLITSVRRAIEFRELQSEISSLKSHLFSDELNYPDAFSEIITANQAMFSTFKYVEAVADSSMPILVTGETGVGKELLVHAILEISSCEGELIKVNVAGLDDNMFTDTLFGHRKGSFTGADQERKGMVERASGGILFLDEIGDLNERSQVKLLRLLQNREYYSMGSDELEFTDARIIVATNRDLQKLHQSETFRKDLFYRLQTHHIHIPALRERKDDVGILADHFLEQASGELDKKRPTAPQELYTLLDVYDFPGNIRELQSMIYDAVSKHKSGKLSLSTFKEHISKTEELKDVDRKRNKDREASTSWFSDSQRLPSLKEAEENLIAESLKRAKGNQSIAARLLGISRQSLNRRLKSK